MHLFAGLVRLSKHPVPPGPLAAEHRERLARSRGGNEPLVCVNANNHRGRSRSAIKL